MTGKLWAGVLAGALFAAPAVGEAPPPLSMDRLLHMSRCELEQLYRQSPPAPVPAGYARGRAIQRPGTRLSVPASRATGLLWQGKYFNPDDCTLVNKICGLKMIRAQVYPGESWLDGGPSLVMDYSRTSRVWIDVRDELREVAPGLYLGIMYRRQCPCPRFVMFFALEAPDACHPR